MINDRIVVKSGAYERRESKSRSRGLSFSIVQYIFDMVPCAGELL